ncbi:MAG: hypothetical protein K8T90_09380 [Planctomycetes bacterium]|nr:hypothetical protein [Planctomycetota bacterium]
MKSKYPLVNPGTPWPGSPDYLYISIGNPNPRTSRAPPFIPEAPVGYTFTFMLPPPAPTMDMFSRLDDEVRSFTFQYVDTAKLVARQAQQAPVAPIPTGPDDVPLPPFSLPPLVHRPMSVTQWDGDYERGARLGDAHIAQLTRSTVALEMNCAPRPGWIDQGAAFVVPRSTQEILRSSAGTAADARLQNSPDAAWGADRGKATSDQVQRSRSVHDHLLNLMTTAWGFKLLAPLVAEVIRAGPWEPFIDSMLAYLDNSGRHRVFSLPRLVSQVPALLDTIGGMLRWATFRAAEEILRNGGRTCFELNGALQIENNVYGRSIWYLVLGHFTLGFRAFVIPGTGRRGGPTSIPSPIPEDRMEIVLWAADRFDINAFAGVLGGNWAERAAFDGIEFPDIRALHGMRMARAFNLLARMPTIVVEWERRRPERARWTGVAMDSDEGSDLAPAWSNPSNSEVNEFNPPSTRSIGAPR